MPYRCPNTSCAIHQKGKEFPAMMDCPMCDTPLESTVSFTPEEEAVLNGYPYVIAYPFRRMLLEEDGRNKLELLAYTFLNGMKLWGLSLASEYFQSTLRSPRINELFRNNLFQPSFGNWNNFLREAIIILQKENTPLVFPEFIAAYESIESGKNVKKYKAETPYTNEEGQIAWKRSDLTAIGALINFRNRYLGHGVPLSREEYSALYKDIRPVLMDFLHALHFTAGLRLIRQDRTDAYLLKGASVTRENDLFTPGKPEGSILLQDDGTRALNMLPFYILPGQFISGADQRAEVLIYEQNTGQRVVFYSPESIKAEESGEVLARIQLLISEKEKTDPCAPGDFTTAYLKEWTDQHNGRTITGLLNEKKILEGIYQNRLDAETALATWTGARSSLFVLAAEAGSGKTNLLAHLLDRYRNMGLTTLLIRASRTRSTDVRELLRAIWNAPAEVDLADFINTAYTPAQPLMILVDGGNEHPDPAGFARSLFGFIAQTMPGCCKVVLSWRVARWSDLPQADSDFSRFIYPAVEREADSLLARNAFRLQGMNKIELEGAWKRYTADAKIRCKPKFSFGDLLVADPHLAGDLGNPLLLRLFLELFNGKPLPASGKGFINLWAKWWEQFRDEPGQAAYLRALAGELMAQRQLQVDLDSLFSHPVLGEAVKNIQIDSPHQQLLRKGVISQYFQDNVLKVSFTVEAALYYVASLDLTVETIPVKVRDHDIWREPVKFFLWARAADARDEVLFRWIDDDAFPAELITRAFAQYLVLHGVEHAIARLLANPTDRDWQILRSAVELLAETRPGEKEARANEVLKSIGTRDDAAARPLLVALLEEAAKPVADAAYNSHFKDRQLNGWREHLGVASYLSRFGRHREALPLLEQAYTDASTEPLEVREQLLEKLIEVCRTLVQLKEAANWLDSWEALFSGAEPGPLRLARWAAARGVLMQRWAKYNEARLCYESSLKINEEIRGGYHEKTLSDLEDLGDVFNYLGNYDEALKHYELVLGRYKQVFGESHPNVAVSYVRIGGIWETKGSYDKALEYFEKDLKISIDYYGESHPNVAVSYNQIGGIWETKGSYDKALEYFEKDLKISIDYYSESHPDVAVSYIRIGDIWNTKGSYDKALEFFEKNLKINLKYYGESHPEVAVSYNRIGSVKMKLNLAEEALNAYDVSLGQMEAFYGADHRKTAALKRNKAHALIRLDRFQEADRLLTEAITTLRQSELENDIVLSSALLYRSKLLRCIHNHTEALEHINSAVSSYEINPGTDSLDAAEAYFEKATILEAMGEFTAAREWFQKCLTNRMARLGAGHPDTVEVQGRLDG